MWLLKQFKTHIFLPISRPLVFVSKCLQIIVNNWNIRENCPAFKKKNDNSNNNYPRPLIIGKYAAKLILGENFTSFLSAFEI